MPKPSKPCQWNGLNFPSIAVCARMLHVQRCTVRDHRRKYGKLDGIKPGKKSTFYKAPPKKVYQRNPGLHGRRKPITWRKKVFSSRKECADYLGYRYDYVVDVYKKKGTVDHLERKLAGTQCTRLAHSYDTPVVWRGIAFTSIWQCAFALERDTQIVSKAWQKYNGNVDSVLPGRSSIYYSQAGDYAFHDCFVCEAVNTFGENAVARAYNTSPERIRECYDSSTLWKFRIERWDATDVNIKFQTRDELFQMLAKR